MDIGNVGESTMSRIRVQLWYNRIKEGREDVNDNASPGRPTTSITDEYTIREVADDVGISFGTCQAIFTDGLGKKRATAMIVSKLQIFKQKQRSINIAQEILMTIQVCSKRS